MGLYSRFVLPKLIHLACSSKPVMMQRTKVIPAATGRVLEIGVGSGLNFSFYEGQRVERLWALEPSPELARKAQQAAEALPFPVTMIDLPGEEIPLDDDSVDTVVLTYTLCTIPDPLAALGQMGRVLRPGGSLLFCEHGAAPDADVRRWQDRLDPLWGRFAGGCHLNRDIPELLRQGGFRVAQLETMYIPGWRPGCFNYWGRAQRERGRSGISESAS